MFAFVLWHDERFVFVHSDEKWVYFFPVRWLVLPHVLGGMIALLIGPFQFSSLFRQRYLRMHRIMGRVYLASVGVSAVVALYVSAIHQKEMQDKEWIFALGITWLLTGAMAFVAVRNGDIEAHRKWIAQLRIYDRLCNDESSECSADSRRLRICTRLDPARGHSVVYRHRTLMERHIRKWEVERATRQTVKAITLAERDLMKMACSAETTAFDSHSA